MYYTNPETRVARKAHCCTYCGEQIEIGSAYKRWMSIDDKALTNKMHPECLSFLQTEAGGDSFEYFPYSGERPATGQGQEASLVDQTETHANSGRKTT